LADQQINKKQFNKTNHPQLEKSTKNNSTKTNHPQLGKSTKNNSAKLTTHNWKINKKKLTDEIEHHV
jgi:hypothetical protein